MKKITEITRYIRSLNHDGCQEELAKIRAVMEKSEYSALVDSMKNDKEVKELYEKEKYRFSEQMFTYVSNGQMIPVYLLNSLCRFLYQSRRHGFPGFMGFNRVTDRSWDTRWLDDMKHPEEACVHAFYIIRKYINGDSAAEIMRGDKPRNGYEHYFRKKDPNERIWALISTMFHNAIHQYYWTMEKKMHDPF